MRSTFGPLPFLILATLSAAPSFPAQTPDKQSRELTFEVESVKPHEFQGGGRGGYNMTRITSDPSLLRMQAVSAGDMALFAWNVTPAQLRNAPPWFFQRLFDVSARTSGPTTRAEQRTMLQDLLRRRFGMICHSETVSGAVYDLTRSPKFSLQKSEDSSTDVAKFVPRLVVHPDQSTETIYSARHATMGDLSAWLGTQVGRPVVDKTETTGSFDIEIRVPGPDANPDSAGKMVYRNDSEEIIHWLASKLGLKLVARPKGNVQILRIDQVHEPTAN